MSKEKVFDISPNEISEIGVSLQEENPKIVWGRGELRNAIFETLVRKHNLPWNENYGIPDWDDPSVKKLSAEFSNCYEAASEIQFIDGIEARCKQKDCSWSGTDQARIEKADRILLECGLTDKCRVHHIETNLATGHNRFSLFKDGESVGGASVSREAATGYIKSRD